MISFFTSFIINYQNAIFLPGPPQAAADQLVHGELSVHYHLYDNQQIHFHLQAHRLPETSHCPERQNPYFTLISGGNLFTYSTLFSKQGCFNRKWYVQYFIIHVCTKTYFYFSFICFSSQK